MKFVATFLFRKKKKNIKYIYQFNSIFYLYFKLIIILKKKTFPFFKNTKAYGLYSLISPFVVGGKLPGGAIALVIINSLALFAVAALGVLAGIKKKKILALSVTFVFGKFLFFISFSKINHFFKKIIVLNSINCINNNWSKYSF